MYGSAVCNSWPSPSVYEATNQRERYLRAANHTRRDALGMFFAALIQPAHNTACPTGHGRTLLAEIGVGIRPSSQALVSRDAFYPRRPNVIAR